MAGAKNQAMTTLLLTCRMTDKAPTINFVREYLSGEFRKKRRCMKTFFKLIVYYNIDTTHAVRIRGAHYD